MKVLRRERACSRLVQVIREGHELARGTRTLGPVHRYRPGEPVIRAGVGWRGRAGLVPKCLAAPNQLQHRCDPGQTRRTRNRWNRHHTPTHPKTTHTPHAPHAPHTTPHSTHHTTPHATHTPHPTHTTHTTRRFGLRVGNTSVLTQCFLSVTLAGAPWRVHAARLLAAARGACVASKLSLKMALAAVAHHSAQPRATLPPSLLLPTHTVVVVVVVLTTL